MENAAFRHDFAAARDELRRALGLPETASLSMPD
jgi:hypothetical protein